MNPSTPYVQLAHRLIANNIALRRPDRRYILIVCHRQENLQWTMQRQSGVITSGGIQSFLSNESRYCISNAVIAEQGSSESVVNVYLMHE